MKYGSVAILLFCDVQSLYWTLLSTELSQIFKAHPLKRNKISFLWVWEMGVADYYRHPERLHTAFVGHMRDKQPC